MGLLNALTKPIKFGSWTHSWREPMMFPIRLRGDLAWRILMALAFWALGTGVMLVVLAFNVNPTSIPLAIGLGAIGLSPAALFLFFRRKHVSGTVWMYDDHLLMQHQYAGFPFLTIRRTEVSYDAIRQAALAQCGQPGRGFYVMLLAFDGGQELVGIPQSVDLRAVGGFLQQRGVPVVSSPQLPAEYCTPLHPAIALLGAGIGVAALIVGLAIYLTAGGRADGDNDNSPADNPPAIAPPHFDPQSVPGPPKNILPNLPTDEQDDSSVVPKIELPPLPGPPDMRGPRFPPRRPQDRQSP